MRKVMFATSEARPFAKTGGLAEVSGSLPLALAELGCEVRLVLPAYRPVLEQARRFTQFQAPPLPGESEPLRLLEGPLNGSAARVWFLDMPELFDRPGGLYLTPEGAEWPDNAWRFGRFCRAVARLADPAAGGPWQPDVVHCHDWQTGLVAPLLAALPRRPATVFTIHNLAYQGVYDRGTFEALGLPEALWSPEALEFWGRFSFIKGGLAFSDLLTTVSPTYAREIQTPELGMGLDGLLRHRADALCGILNGVDYADWDPASDPALTHPYGREDLERKGLEKRALQRELGLEERDDVLLLGSVTRLAGQKGIDLVLDALPALHDRPIQWAVLGEGEAWLRERLLALAAERPGRFAVRIGYHEGLSHRINAGADAVLMPSRFEPCGLNQIHGLRYGTLPIVRHTGGLVDTVIDATPAALGEGRATGFVFGPATPQAIVETLERVLAVFALPERWRAMQRNAMEQDFSWDRSAAAYLGCYERALGRAGAA